MSWGLAATLARLPGNLAPLGFVVALPGSAGAVAAAGYTAGVAVGAAWRGRVIDRAGMRDGLRRECLLLGAAAALLAAVLAIDGPGAATVLAAMVMGVAGSAVGVAYRAALPTFVPARSLPSAYTTDAVITELSFVISPLIVAACVAMAPPWLLFASAALLAVGSYLAGGGLPRTTTRSTADADGERGWVRAGLSVYAITAAIGLGYGLLMAGVPGRLAELGWTGAAAGSVFALMSGASAVVGVVIATTGRLTTPAVGVVAGLTVPFAAATAVIAVSSTAALVAIAMAVFGLPLAALSGLGTTALATRVPDGTLARALSLFAAMVTTNAGIGFALAAVLLEVAGVGATLVASAAVYAALTLSVTAAWMRGARVRRRA